VQPAPYRNSRVAVLRARLCRYIAVCSMMSHACIACADVSAPGSVMLAMSVTEALVASAKGSEHSLVRQFVFGCKPDPRPVLPHPPDTAACCDCLFKLETGRYPCMLDICHPAAFLQLSFWRRKWWHAVSASAHEHSAAAHSAPSGSVQWLASVGWRTEEVWTRPDITKAWEVPDEQVTAAVTHMQADNRTLFMVATIATR